METVKMNTDFNKKWFSCRGRQDQPDQPDYITKAAVIKWMDTMKVDLIDRINKVKTDLIVWIVGVSILQYILLMVTLKFF